MTAVAVEIHNSDRSTFRQCRSLWDFRSPLRGDYMYLPGIEPLDFGIAVHLALNVLYDPERWEDEREVVEAEAIGAFYQYMLDWQKRIRQAGVWDDEQDRIWNDLVAMGTGMLKHYYLWYPNADRPYRPVKSEISFEVPIPVPEGMLLPKRFMRSQDGYLLWDGAVVVAAGRIDLILQDLTSGEYWILDHKTAAQFGQTEHLELDTQCGTYYWALRKALGVNVAGVIYSELRKKVPSEPNVLKDGNLSKNKAQSTTPEIYRKTIERLNLDPGFYEDFLQTLNAEGQMYFRRIKVHRSDHELAAIERALLFETLDMLDDPRIYPNPSRWNCNGCKFRTPCLIRQESGDWEWQLKSSGLYVKQSELELAH